MEGNPTKFAHMKNERLDAAGHKIRSIFQERKSIFVTNIKKQNDDKESCEKKGSKLSYNRTDALLNCMPNSIFANQRYD